MGLGCQWGELRKEAVCFDGIGQSLESNTATEILA